MKTEPSVFSFDDLVKAPGRKTHWDCVRNYKARNLMRDEFKIGDKALVYHSNIEEPVIAGVAEVCREGYPDPKAMDPKSDYFDESAKKKGVNPWVMVDIKAVQTFATPVTRSTLKATPALKNMMVLKKGARLSVQPVTSAEFEKIVSLGKAKKL